ncbi:unnamed protein product [Thlaspi arvense]|uniref:LAGLIDADG homing endonuclease n=1 Tax=Thlaspi arvense TaxID=13288 RepID=A0AAU9SWX0_THLAR|nr:unnamed protein product [Thlaspi arvense]
MLALLEIHSDWFVDKGIIGVFKMGNKATTVKEERQEIHLKIVPPLDKVFLRWLARDLQRVQGFKPKNNTRAITPPDSYIEFMRLNGSLDVDLDDPDLAHLFK